MSSGRLAQLVLMNPDDGSRQEMNMNKSGEGSSRGGICDCASAKLDQQAVHMARKAGSW
jgi:hypothetical protein